jgi:hypothetical protein
VKTHAIAVSAQIWLLLPARLLLFALFQALIALGFMLGGSLSAWERSAAWWPFTVTLTNVVCLLLLTRLYRHEGNNYWQIFRFERGRAKGDLLALLGILVVSGPVAFLPNPMLANALFGDTLAPMGMFMQPLPDWAIYSGMLLFPVTQGLVELPFYFIYVMPRLGMLTGKPWLAYILASLLLGLQHLAAPLLFDGRFIIWRGLMFLPFAFLVGLALKWRPRLLPYLVIVHILMDFAAMTVYLTGF